VVLLLHGGGQTRHSWHRTARSLAGQGWSAVALDARGHGDSQWAPDRDYSIDALVADLAAVVTELGERPVLVGASMGGMTALVGQGERGDLARALVLVDIVPRIEPEGAKRIMDFMTARPDGFGSLEEVADAVRAYNPHRARPVSPEGLRKNVRLARTAGGAGTGIRRSWRSVTSRRERRARTAHATRRLASGCRPCWCAAGSPTSSVMRA
jgi:pimeloyl-ACP methyl ester carboxylesterase